MDFWNNAGPIGQFFLVVGGCFFVGLVIGFILGFIVGQWFS